MFEKFEKLEIVKSASMLMKRVSSASALVSVADEENSDFDSDEEEKEERSRTSIVSAPEEGGTIKEIEMGINPSLKLRKTTKQPDSYGDIIFNKRGSKSTINPLHREL